MRQHKRRLDAKVVQQSALQKITIHFLVTIPELQCGTWREPVCEPSLTTASRAPHPACEQIAVICVAVTITPEIPINKAGRKLPRMRGTDDLGAKIHFMKLGQHWHIQAHVERGPTGEQRSVFVHHQGIAINRQPLAQSGNTIAEIKVGDSLSGIHGGIGGVCVEGSKEVVESNWQPRPPEHRGETRAKLKVGRRFKTYLEAMHVGLRLNLARTDQVVHVPFELVPVQSSEDVL